MEYRSTAKQRLWLTCLGYDLPETASSDDVRSLFDDASNNGRYQELPTSHQKRLGQEIGVNVDQEATRGDAAGKLYRVWLLNAWVYSVWRFQSGNQGTTYDQLGLSILTALAIARDLEQAGMHEQIEQFSTTDGRESDVFYRMSSSAQASEPFRFAIERLPNVPRVREKSVRDRSTQRSTPAAPHESWAEKRSQQIAQRSSSPPARGKGCLVLCVLFTIAFFTAGCSG